MPKRGSCSVPVSAATATVTSSQYQICSGSSSVSFMNLQFPNCYVIICSLYVSNNININLVCSHRPRFTDSNGEFLVELSLSRLRTLVEKVSIMTVQDRALNKHSRSFKLTQRPSLMASVMGGFKNLTNLCVRNPISRLLTMG